MSNFVLLVLCVFLVTTTFARSPAAVTFQIPTDDFDLDNNEIDRDAGPIMNVEKQLALDTNEVRPLPAPRAIPVTIDDSKSTDVDYQGDMNQDVPLSSGFINQSKAPSSITEYILDFMWGLGVNFCQWIYNKFLS